MNRKLNIGVIGLGVGEQHCHAYSAIDDCHLHSICDFDQDKLNSVSALFSSDVQKANEAETILNNPEIDVISIASWDNFHYEHIVSAIENGKHIFVEKPFVQRESEAIHIFGLLSQKPDLKVSSNLILRKCERFLELKQNIHSGKLGELISIEGDYNYGRLHKIINSWRGKVDGYSGIFGGGIHIVDLLHWLSNRRITRVCAYGSNKATSREQFRNFDYITAVVKFEDGLCGRISVHLGCVYPHFHRLSVYGTEATFQNDYPNARLFQERDSIEYSEIISAYPGTNKGDFIPNFIECIRNDAVPEISVAEIFEGMAVCFAIEKSAHTGSQVDVNYFWETST